MDELYGLMPPAGWAAFCLAIAAVYIKFWPWRRAARQRGLRRFVLRWFHALVWVSLAAAVFLRGQDRLALHDWARGIALVALLLYITFLVATYAGREPSDER